MRIKSIEVLKNYIKLPSPLSISFETFHYSEIYYLKIETDTNLVGWGEGAPFQPITGDSEQSVREELPKLRRLIGLELGSLEDSLDLVLDGIQSRSLMASLDFAVHDLIAQSERIPVYRLYGSTPRKIPNSVTVFLQESSEDNLKETRRILSLYPDLELLKIKLSGKDDFERCRAIKSITPPHMKFVLDANQGFKDERNAVLILNKIIEELGDVLLIEEPCQKNDYNKAHYIKENIEGSKIVADESCRYIGDLEEIIEREAFHGVNIKLQKAGGIREGKRLADLGKEHNLSMMVGQMFESPLSTAASLALAVTCENIVLTDLDMDLDLPNFTTGKALFVQGSRMPLEVPGFGFGLIEELIKAPEIERDVWFRS